MIYLLDTNVLSELQKGSRCNERVAAWFSSVADDELFLSVLVIGEIRRGIERLRSRDQARSAMLDGWLNSVETRYRSRILPVDRLIADDWGRLSLTRSLPVVDALMVATARVYDLVFVTRNVKHATGLGVSTLNPFEPDKP